MQGDGIIERSRFVVPTTLIEPPADRLERLLTEELGSIEHVMRYLLLLLAPEDALAAMGARR